MPIGRLTDSPSRFGHLVVLALLPIRLLADPADFHARECGADSEEIFMSRLAEAEAKLNAALDALESAVDDALEVLAANEALGEEAGNGEVSVPGIDRAKVLAEIDQIDQKVAMAIKLINNVQSSQTAEGGSA